MTASSEPSFEAARGAERADLLIEMASRLRDSEPERALTLVEEAKTLVADHPEPRRELALGLALGGLYSEFDRHRDALREAEKAVELARTLEDRPSAAAALHHLGRAHRSLADHAEALVAIDEAIGLYEELGEIRSLADATRDAGVTLRRMGDLSGALERYFRALELYEELGVETGQAAVLNNIGIAYRRLERYDEAQSFYERALSMETLLGREASEARLLNNIGVLLLDTGDVELALDHFRRSLAIKIKLGDQASLTSTLSNLGLSYYDLGRDEEAMEHYERALGVYESIEGRYGLSELLVRTARAQHRMGRIDGARENLLRAIAEAEASGAKHDLRDAWLELAEIEEDSGRIAEAYTALRSYDVLRGELLDAESREKLAELEARYHAEERERQIELLEQEQAITELQRQRLETVVRALAIGGVLTLLVFVLWISRLRLRAQAAAAQARQEERERYIVELEAKNAEMERFTLAVSHDLKSPLLTIRGFVALIVEDARSGDFARLEEDVERVDRAAVEMTGTLNELLRLSRAGRALGPPEEIELGDLAASAGQRLAGVLEEAGAQLVIAADLPRVAGDPARLSQVFQNLIENAARYGGAKPRIEVGRRGEGPSTVVFVRDDGPGIAPRHHEEIFGLFERLDSPTEGSGIGLALVERIIEVHEGRIWVESRGEGDGATFCFVLPWLDPDLPASEGGAA